MWLCKRYALRCCGNNMKITLVLQARMSCQCQDRCLTSKGSKQCLFSNAVLAMSLACSEGTRRFDGRRASVRNRGLALLVSLEQAVGGVPGRTGDWEVGVAVNGLRVNHERGWGQMLNWGQFHEGGRMSLRQAGVEGGNKEGRILISARSVARPAGHGL